MDGKKKNFFGNFRFKKLPNLKRPGKKPAEKTGKMLAYRRSISVPDLTIMHNEAFSPDSALASTAADAISFGISPGLSDSDSVTSGSIPDGPVYVNRITSSASETRLRIHPDNQPPALNRVSAPTGTTYEETHLNGQGSWRKVNITKDPVYAQIDKTKKQPPKFTFDPIPSPRSIYTEAHCSSPRLGLLERERLSESDRASPGTVTTAFAGSKSEGGKINSLTELKSTPLDQGKMSPGKGTTPAIKPNPFMERIDRTPPAIKAKASADRMFLDTQFTAVESIDGTSQASTCGTPSEERAITPWTNDSDGLDQEPVTPFMMSVFSTEEFLLDRLQAEEVPEDMPEIPSESFDIFEEALQDPSDLSQVTTAGPVALQRYLLSINLKKGKNLCMRNKRSGTIDPYVKFKLEGKQLYKSKVVYKSLNPHWNESFSSPLRDKEHAVEVRVYDKNRTADEFMGSSVISLKNLELYKTYEMELRLDPPKNKDDDIGVIIVDVCLMYRDATIKRSPRWPAKKNKQKVISSHGSVEVQRNLQRNQTWTGVFTITLVEGLDLPHHGQGDIYVRFRLGDQKYKSKNLCIQANPRWREQFDFNQLADNQEPLQVEVLAKRGRKGVESWGIFEIDLSRLPVKERQLYTHVLDPGKGSLVFLVTLRPCWGVSITDSETAILDKSEEREMIMEKFSLKNSYQCVGDVGFLQVKVMKANDLPATDLNGKSNPFCVIELRNSKLQTHTIYKNLNPEWNKAFTLPIRDIHDVAEFTVLDENGEKAPNFLGKLCIPLLSVQNKQQVCLFLKKEDLNGLSKGTITLVLEVIYNKVRAGIRTFKPQEAKFTEDNPKFSKKVLARNIYRVRKISTAVLYTLQYIKSCFQWESTQRSIIAFLIFLLTVWNWELYMLPLFLLLLIAWNYTQLSKGKSGSSQDLVNMSMGDDEEDDEKESGKKSLMDKIHMVQEVVLTVQNVLGEIANIGERVKNVFNWSVPFLSCLSFLVLFVAASLLYLIPLRYIVLIWGVKKFTKKLWNPYAIDNNEILDFLRRVPSDIEKVQYSTLRAPTGQSQPRKKK